MTIPPIGRFRPPKPPSNSDFLNGSKGIVRMRALKISLIPRKCEGAWKIANEKGTEEGIRFRHSSDSADSELHFCSGRSTPSDISSSDLSDPDSAPKRDESHWEPMGINGLWGLDGSIGFIGLSLIDPEIEEGPENRDIFTYSGELRLNLYLRELIGEMEFIPRSSYLSLLPSNMMEHDEGNSKQLMLNILEGSQIILPPTPNLQQLTMQPTNRPLIPHSSVISFPSLPPFPGHIPASPLHCFVPLIGDPFSLPSPPMIVHFPTHSLVVPSPIPPPGYILSLCHCTVYRVALPLPSMTSSDGEWRRMRNDSETSTFDSGMDSEYGELFDNGEETIEDEERTPREIPILNEVIIKEDDVEIQLDSSQLKEELLQLSQSMQPWELAREALLPWTIDRTKEEKHRSREELEKELRELHKTDSYLTRFHSKPSIVNNSINIEADAEIDPFVDFSPLYTQSTHVEIRIDTFLPLELQTTWIGAHDRSAWVMEAERIE